MKTTVIECDSCGGRVERPERPELCEGCAGGFVDLRGVAFMEWPRLLGRDSVRAVLEQRDKTEADLRAQVRDAQRAAREAEAEAARARRRASDAYAGGDMAAGLLDVASGARRA